MGAWETARVIVNARSPGLISNSTGRDARKLANSKAFVTPWKIRETITFLTRSRTYFYSTTLHSSFVFSRKVILFFFFFFKLFPCSWNQRKWFLALHRSPCFLFWSVSMKFYSTRCAKLLQLKLAGEKKAETLRARNEISRAFILLCFCLFFVKLYWLTQRTKA